MDKIEEPPVYTPANPRRGLDVLICITACCYDFIAQILASILFVFHLIFVYFMACLVGICSIPPALGLALLTPYQLLSYVSVNRLYKCWLADWCTKPEHLYSEYDDAFRWLHCNTQPTETRILVDTE